MADIVQALKTRARLLHKEFQDGNNSALARLGALPKFKNRQFTDILHQLQRRHCLSVVALEAGFAGWPQAAQILKGGNPDDFGTTLYPRGCGAHSNIWLASYEEAKRVRAEHGGFLLAYKKQFLVVDDDYIRTMGLDPHDPDFEKIGRDWVSPASPKARARLYGKLIPLTWS